MLQHPKFRHLFFVVVAVFYSCCCCSSLLVSGGTSATPSTPNDDTIPIAASAFEIEGNQEQQHHHRRRRHHMRRHRHGHGQEDNNSPSLSLLLPSSTSSPSTSTSTSLSWIMSMTSTFMKYFFPSWSSSSSTSDGKTVLTNSSPNRHSSRCGRHRRGRRHLEENTTEVDKYPYPEFRFTPWNDIPAEHRKWALDLGYDVDGFEWNLVNDSAVEGFDYSTLIRDFETAGNEDAIDAMNNFGYDENVWDCWINHYSYFDWEEFVQYEFVEPLIVLGWNQSSWDGDAPEPESDSKDWIELTVEERAAAEELCYFEEVWDGLPLDTWWDTDSPTQTPFPTEEPTKEPTTKPPTKSPTRQPTKAPTTKEPTTERPVTESGSDSDWLDSFYSDESGP